MTRKREGLSEIRMTSMAITLMCLVNDYVVYCVFMGDEEDS